MMHEQLFANMDNMNMLFSPVFLQVNSFVWDETRSVRANIREFINSYYHLALGSARLLKDNKYKDDNLIKIIHNLKNEITFYKELYERQCEITKQQCEITNLISELRR